MSKKAKVLFIMQLPPPVHGTSIMNNYIKESSKINKAFKTEILSLKFVDHIHEIGKISFVKIFKAIGFIFKLLYRLVVFKPDLIYYTIAPFGAAFYRDAIYVFLSKLFKKKIVFHMHGKGIKVNSEKSQLKRSIYRYVFKGTKMIILSKRLYDDVKLVYEGNPYVLSNCIKEQKEVPVAMKRKNKKLTFIFLSNLKVDKGIKVFLEAIKIVSDKGYCFDVRIIGNSTTDFSVEEAKDFINQNNLEHLVKELGPKYGRAKYIALSNADVLVFPTNYKNETFGLVNLEAMQMGLAVITSNIGAIPDIVEHNTNGFIIDEVTSVKVAENMIKYLINNELVMNHRTNNIQKFKTNYTLDIFENKFINILDEIIES